MRNNVKAKLKNGEPSIGTWVAIGHPDISEALAMLGFEWMVFDMEHGPLDIETVQRMMQSMSYSTDCIPMIRVGWNDNLLIKRALDIGAYGVVVPWVNTKEEARKVVQYCKYAPEGIRGVSPRRALMHDPEYIETANNEILIVVQIETELAIKNIDSICSVKGIDVCFVGPWDLSMSLGVFENYGHPKYKNAIDKILESCERFGISPGMYCGPDNINEAVAQGFQFCALSSDDEFLQRGATEALRMVKGWNQHSKVTAS